MTAFTTLIYIKPNTATDEKIAVGLLASGINKIHFAYSKPKLNKALGLANIDLSNTIERYFKNIAKSIDEDNSKEIHFSENYILNKEYINYLNKYDNGIIYFEKPTIMAFPLNDMQFSEIFKIMLGEPLLEKTKTHDISFTKSFRNKIETRQKLNLKADIIYKVKPNDVKGILHPVEVDFISINGAIFAGMHVDFCTEPNTIIKHVYEFKSLVNGLNKFSVTHRYKANPACNIYFNNPEGKEQKDLLVKLRKDDSTENITVKESETVEKDLEKIETNNYRKFSSELELESK